MTAYEILTIIISLLALGVSLATYIWTIKYRGKLEWHFLPNDNVSGDFICTIVNSGQKSITPLRILVITKKGNFLPLTPENGDMVIKKLLQPGEILQFSFHQNLKFMAGFADATSLVLVDAYQRTFPLDKQEFSAIKDAIKP